MKIRLKRRVQFNGHLYDKGEIIDWPHHIPLPIACVVSGSTAPNGRHEPAYEVVDQKAAASAPATQRMRVLRRIADRQGRHEPGEIIDWPIDTPVPTNREPVPVLE